MDLTAFRAKSLWVIYTKGSIKSVTWHSEMHLRSAKTVLSRLTLKEGKGKRKVGREKAREIFDSLNRRLTTTVITTTACKPLGMMTCQPPH